MDHAEVLDRLAEAAVTARGIDRLQMDASLETSVREHMEACAACRDEAAAWMTTAEALIASTPDSQGAPPQARERILAAVASMGVPRGADSASVAMPGDVPGAPAHPEPVPPARPAGPTPIRFPRLALAAAAVLAIFVAGAVLGGPLGLTPKDKGAAALAAAVGASNQILQQPAHREAVLVHADGVTAGSVLVDPQNGRIVILSTAVELTDPEEYHCYLVRDGQPALWIGPMHNEEGTSFWAGWVRDVADLGRPGDVVQVMDGGTEPELTATF